MTITKKNENGIITLELEGQLDSVTSPQLEEEVNAIEEATAIIFDFALVEYISSAGLRQVLFANKKAKNLGARFSVINAGAQAMSIFHLTGVEKKLDIKSK